MKSKKIEQIREMANSKPTPLTLKEKQWLKENVSDVFKSDRGLPVVICGYFEPGYEQKLAMAKQISEKLPLHVINIIYDPNL